MDDLNVKFIRNVIIGAFTLILLTMAGCGSFYTVEQGERGIHTRTGAFIGVSHPGFHMKAPFVDDVKTIDVRQQAVKWQLDASGDSRMESYSRDQQPAHISLNVAWEIPSDDKNLEMIFTTYGSRAGLYNTVVLPKAVEAVKNTFGLYDAVTVIQQRARFNADVAVELTRLFDGYPVILRGVQVQDISFSDAYEGAIEARMQAQVLVQKKEQEKQTAQINADMQVIAAEADAKQTRLQGEANAAITRIRGEAEAAAIKARADALASNAKLVELTAAEKWNGVLPTTMVPGSTVPFLTVR